MVNNETGTNPKMVPSPNKTEGRGTRYHEYPTHLKLKVTEHRTMADRTHKAVQPLRASKNKGTGHHGHPNPKLG